MSKRNRQQQQQAAKPRRKLTKKEAGFVGNLIGITTNPTKAWIVTPTGLTVYKIDDPTNSLIREAGRWVI